MNGHVCKYCGESKVLSEMVAFRRGSDGRTVVRTLCKACRAANSRYSAECERRKRAGLGNPLVPADDARAHLRALSKKGVGYKTAADTAGVAISIVAKILSGERKQIRKQTSDRLLDVTAQMAADGAYVGAAMTWRRIRWLLNEGFTKTALKVEKLYNLMRTGE